MPIKSHKLKKKLSKVEIPDNADNEVIIKAIDSQFRYSIVGYVIGGIIIVFGIFLTLLGIYLPLNNISLKFLSLYISIDNATPGIILFLIGLVIIVSTRFSVKVKKKQIE